MINRLKPMSEFSRNVLTLMTGKKIVQDAISLIFIISYAGFFCCDYHIKRYYV